MRTLRRRPAALSLARLAAATLAAAFTLAGAACSNGKGKDAGAQATVPTAPATTTTTAPADPYAIPSDPSKIDADYVNRVLAALNHVYGNSVRNKLEKGRVEPADLVPIRSVYGDPEFATQAQIFATSAVPNDVIRPPGDRKMTVDHLLTRRGDCISAVVLEDFSALRASPPPPIMEWIALNPVAAGNDPNNTNPTPWWFVYEKSIESDPCVH